MNGSLNKRYSISTRASLLLSNTFMMSKRTKYIIAAVVVILLLIFIRSRMGKDLSIKVSTEKVSRNTIIETVSANGKVQPETEVKISPDVSGEVVELYVKEGQEVKKGDLLAKINPNIYESSLERITASVNTAKADLANAKSQEVQAKSQFEREAAAFARSKKLVDEGTISAAEFETAKSVFEVARANAEGSKQRVLASSFAIKSAEASLKEANDNLQKTSIIAPVSGIVSKLNIEKGERVVGTSQMAGTEMMRIANVQEMEVSADVNENDIVRVSVGDTAVIEVDAYLDKKFKGIVTEVANSATTTGVSTDQVTNFMVKIRILSDSYTALSEKSKNGQSPFRPGMSATVDIQTNTVKSAVSVPIQAVTTREPGDTVNAGSRADSSKGTSEITECVFVYKQGKVVLVPVKTGIQNNTFIQIVSGLKGDEEVVTAPYSAISKVLKNNDKVTIVAKEQLFKKDKE